MKRFTGAGAPRAALAGAMTAVVSATGVVSFLVQDLRLAVATIVVAGLTSFVWLAVSRTAGLACGVALVVIAAIVLVRSDTNPDHAATPTVTTQRPTESDTTTTSTTTPPITPSDREVALGAEHLIGAPGDPDRISCSWVPASTAATVSLAGQRYGAGFFNDGGYLADELARTCFHERDDVPPLQLSIDDAYDAFGATVGVDDRSAASDAVDITVFALVGPAPHVIASGSARLGLPLQVAAPIPDGATVVEIHFSPWTPNQALAVAVPRLER